MLFKNLKSGNIVSVSDASTAELMRRSESYEEIRVSVVSKVQAQTETKKKKTKDKK